MGNYLFLEELGRGAFGVAYKAKHIPTGEIRVVKDINVSQIGQ